ncbi:MAG: NUDIX hydrolase [Rickettsiales bacterium]|jgi:8-oxo-dGTP pyrophosphatase MutT (NUDIX family)|nr:NUDIX hydrolase [Rickettsiales bacterium]
MSCIAGFAVKHVEIRPWKEESREEVFKTGPVSLQKLNLLDPNGGKTSRVRLSLGGNTALVIPETEDGRFVMCQQYKVGVDKPFIEFPNGGIKAGENPMVAAQRELAEELNLAGDFGHIGSFHPLPTVVELRVDVFTCRNLKQEALPSDDYEVVNGMILSRGEIDNLIRKGGIFDAYTLSSLQLYDLSTKK